MKEKNGNLRAIYKICIFVNRKLEHGNNYQSFASWQLQVFIYNVLI
jgi:hypothetical protein